MTEGAIAAPSGRPAGRRRAFPPTFALLAWKEFSRAFWRRAPGGRDFFWLAALLCLLQVLALTMYSAREGVLERSVDAFLGYEPEYGIPVWTRPNAVGYGGISMISDELIESIEADGYPAEPFRRIFGRTLVRPPSPDSWSVGSSGDMQDTFVGIVADLDGPIAPSVTLPTAPSRYSGTLEELWPIVLDIDVFHRYFDLQRYRGSVSGRIPEGAYAEIPADIADLALMPMIWLEITTPIGNRLMPFRVTWGRYLGVGSAPVAYMVDRRFHVAVEAIDQNPALCIDVTGGPAFPAAVTEVRSERLFVLPQDRREAIEQRMTVGLQAASAEFGGEVRASTSRVVWQPATRSNRSECPAWIPSTTLAMFLADASLVASDDHIDAGDDAPGVEIARMSVDPGFGVTAEGYSAPCEKLSDEALRFPDTRQEATDHGCVAHVSATPDEDGYGEMLMFATERTQIDELRDYINCAEPEMRAAGAAEALARPFAEDAGALCRLVRTPAGDEVVQSRLMLSEVYQDSLARLGFLTRLLETVSGPVGVGLVLLLIAILQVQIGTVVGHRRKDYALLLANGFSSRQLTAMVMLQMMLGALFAMIAALAVFSLFRVGLLYWSDALATDFERILQGRRIDVLPLSPMGVIAILALVLAMSSFFSWWQMRRNGVSAKGSVEDLLR
jgi:hypothetical protein